LAEWKLLAFQVLRGTSILFAPGLFQSGGKAISLCVQGNSEEEKESETARTRFLRMEKESLDLLMVAACGCLTQSCPSTQMLAAGCYLFEILFQICRYDACPLSNMLVEPASKYTASLYRSMCIRVIMWS